MTLPQEIAKHIEQQAMKYAQVRCNDFEGKKHLHRKTLLMYAHLAGATEWAGKAQPVIDALEKISNYEHTCGCHPCRGQCATPEALLIEIEGLKEIAASALAKYKEVGK